MHPAALRAHSQSPCLARPSCILTSTALLLIDCSQLHTGLFPVPLMCQPLASPSAWNNRPSDILSHPQYFHALGKEMAPHSSTLAWRIPWTEEPGGLQSMGSLGVGPDWATSLSLFTFMHWRRKWQPTAVFLPGESQGRRSLVGCRLWGHTESDTTEVT